MILADLRGADGHGIFRLPQYVRRIRAGGMNVRPNIRVARFSPVETFKRNVDQVIREMRNSRKMPGVDQIRLPGEQSHATWLERSALGIPLNDALFKDLQRLASDLGIEGLPASD